MPSAPKDPRKPTMMENVKTVNSVVRTGMLAAILGCVGFGGYFGYTNYIKPSTEWKQAQVDLKNAKEELAKKDEEIKAASAKNDKLQTALKLLKIDRRVAHLKVIEKGKDENGGDTLKVQFAEVDENGEIIGIAKDFTLKGKMFYVDCWVAKFEDEYIEQADEFRSATMFTFKSIYGDAQQPNEGFPLDVETGSNPPGIYGQSEKTKFEEKIWGDFWAVCNDKHKQADLGIRAIHGQANYLPPVVGKTYEITIRNSGSVSLIPIDDEP